MVQEALTSAAIAACLPCNHLWLRTPTAPNCLMCGGPPTRLIAFPDGDAAGPVVMPPASGEPAPSPDATEITVDCPHCRAPIVLRVTDDEIEAVLPEPVPAPEPEPEPVAAGAEPEPTPPLAGGEPVGEPSESAS